MMTFASFRRPALALTFLAGLLTAPLTTEATEIAGVPASNEIAFTVIRNGDDIGTHVLHFQQKGDQTLVDVKTDIVVKLPLVGIAVYRFEHHGTETWQNGRLVKLDSKTNDDGTAHHLSVALAGDALNVDSDVGSHNAAATIIPASLWNPALRQQSVLLNTLDGTEMPVTVEDLGQETVKVHGQDETADHVKVSGGLNRELWYNAKGDLVQVRFMAKDDTQIDYVLQ